MYNKILPEINEIGKYKGKLFYAYLALNNICNANCIFCNVHEEVHKSSIIDVFGLIFEMKKLGTEYVHFMGGGEPFVDPNIFDYIREVSDLGMKVAVTTNGYALDKEKIDFLSTQNISHMIFSVDGHCSEIHDGIRRVKGLWDKVTENIKYIKRMMPDTKIIINHVLNNRNIMFLDKMIQLKRIVPYDYLNILLVKDCDMLYFTKEQVDVYNQHMNDYIQLAKAENVEFLYDKIDFFSEGPVEYSKGLYLSNDYSCVFPYFSAYVDCTTGYLYPCDCTVHRDPKFYICGDLKKDKLSEIWTSHKMAELRHMLCNDPVMCKENCDYANRYFNSEITHSGLNFEVGNE